ncbi:hypothetical protein [uncultured Desulfuromusa sp.]|uniref:hypothetical protein n=1 Tax=uncultured Desulfuromusa sp. TaxID=219183 RepID=UPI002AA626A0|nr:hypothetical protein [uncultured Desulfuromusa sp.]
MIRSYNILFFLISVAWVILSTFLIMIYATGKLGPTPLFLPTILAGVSLIGIAIGIILWVCSKRIKMITAIISLILYGVSFVIQLKAFAGILYVS